MSTDRTVMACRFCRSETIELFQLNVLGKFRVRYYECKSCKSLQTERPYWLPEAYSATLSYLDTGAAQRNLTNAAAVALVAWLTRCKNLLDFGGGDGLLCRLLRDYGLNCFVRDKFARASYSQGFREPDFEKPDLLLAFEVFEHFAEPSVELAGIFAENPPIVVATTEEYSGQGRDWWYLTPASGQHVFFYSRKALLDVADRFGYSVHFLNKYIVYSKTERISRTTTTLLHLALGRAPLRIVRAVLLAGAARGVARDFELLQRRSPKDNGQ